MDRIMDRIMSPCGEVTYLWIDVNVRLYDDSAWDYDSEYEYNFDCDGKEEEEEEEEEEESTLVCNKATPGAKEAVLAGPTIAWFGNDVVGVVRWCRLTSGWHQV